MSFLEQNLAILGNESYSLFSVGPVNSLFWIRR